jgi:probable F420-dependent oxidoreductase
VGYFSSTWAGGISPAELGVELERRGFDSVWLPEHSHIPVDREPAPPFGSAIPDAYFHLLNPFVALSTVAAVTTQLTIATGVCMALEHDVLDLAGAVASLDVVSGGRVHFGVGVGWLREELANHRPDVPFQQRYSALVERVEALRRCWVDEDAEFAGRWDRFTRSVVSPKPVQPRLPVGFGCSGPFGMRLAAEHADAWLPIDAALAAHGGVEAALDRFGGLVTAAGRDPADVPVTLFVWGWEDGVPGRDLLDRYAGLPIERIVLLPPTMARHDRDTTLRRLNEFQPFVDESASTD